MIKIKILGNGEGKEREINKGGIVNKENVLITITISNLYQQRPDYGTLGFWCI